MASLTNGRIICSYTPMRKIPNLFHNGYLNLEANMHYGLVLVVFVFLIPIKWKQNRDLEA